MVGQQSAPRIAVIGNYVFDMIVRPVAHLPNPGELMLVDQISVAGGGAGFTTSIALARLGARVVSGGALGDDEQGEQVRRWLEADGVDTAKLQTVDAPTSSTVGMVSAAGERSYLHAPGASASMRANVSILDAPDLAGVHVGAALIMEGLDVDEGGVTLLRTARERGIRTSLDTSWDSTGRWRRVDAYLPYLDVFCPSLLEARQVTGRERVEDVAAWIIDHGSRSAVIHAGEVGAYVASEDFTGWVPSYRVDVVDTTGAGESFDAGLVFGLCSGWPIESAVRLACAVGALATTKPGAIGGVTALDAALALTGPILREEVL